MDATPQTPPAAFIPTRLGLSAVRVAEVTAERVVDDPPEIPWQLTPPVGEIALQLRSTVRRVAIGAGLARDQQLVLAVRRLPDVPAVVTSPAGGTFIIGGEAWLGLCAIGSPPPGQPMPLDWMLHSLHRWLQRALQRFAVMTAVERVEGAWCPGFSDIAVSGRKLAGLGFRVTRDRVVMRGVMAVRPMTDRDFDVLVRCHRLIGVELRRESAISLAEAAGAPDLDVAAAIDALRDVVTGAP
ncbi:MAG: lipoyl protein ligase domain-containing protein [Candidatus Dormibacteria bacterium]